MFKLFSSNPEGIPERGVSVMSKEPPQNEKTIFCRVLSNGIVPIHGANVSCRLCCHPSIELKEMDISEMFQFLNLALHF